MPKLGSNEDILNIDPGKGVLLIAQKEWPVVPCNDLEEPSMTTKRWLFLEYLRHVGVCLCYISEKPTVKTLESPVPDLGEGWICSAQRTMKLLWYNCG